MSRKRRSLIGGGTAGPASLVPDVEPPDDESSVRTEPFRQDVGDALDESGSLDSGSLSESGTLAPPAESTPAEPSASSAEGDASGLAAPSEPAGAPTAGPVDPPAPAAAEPPLPPPPTSLPAHFEEKDDWFVRTGTPAASREAEPELVAPTAPNPQLYVAALLVAVVLGVLVLGVVYLAAG